MIFISTVQQKPCVVNSGRLFWNDSNQAVIMTDVPARDRSLRNYLSGIKVLQPLRVRNFRLLWIGSLISYVGAQLTLIAFPWLVLKLTGDPVAMGTVFALSSIPRVVFMVFGGAFTDRFSARTMMIWSTVSRMGLMIALTLLVLSGTIQMSMVYVIALLFGVLDAFFWPASSAIVPRLVVTEQLPAANALIQGISQMSVMLGPVVAGLIISLFSGGAGEDSTDLKGIGLVFLLDSVSFLVALLTLFLIRLQTDTESHPPFTLSSVYKSVSDGFAAMWNDLPIRIMTLVFATFSLFWRGPYLVGIPVLCDTRFEDGAMAFGLISSSYGVGALIGILAAGSLPKLKEKWFGILCLFDTAILGSAFWVYAITPTVNWAVFITAFCGIVDGYLMVVLISWLQARVQTELLGRVMSMIMVFNSGLAPVSAALAGWLISISLGGVFLGAGSILVGLSLFGLCVPVVRRFGMAPT
jgi:MFS family permease